jgi:TRAP-type C4-dicarboxylate transport system permease small subunit
MEPLEKILIKVLDAVVAVFFAAILFITLLQVTLRYGFNSGILGGNELMEFLFIYSTALGAAVAVRRRQHINISYFIEALPRALYRFVDAFGWLSVAFLNGILIWTSISWIRQVGGNESPVMRIPEWTVQISIPIGCGLVILYCLSNVAACFRQGYHAEDSEETC